MSAKPDPYADLMAGIAKVMAEPTLPNATDRLCWLSGYVQHSHPELSRALMGLAGKITANPLSIRGPTQIESLRPNVAPPFWGEPK